MASPLTVKGLVALVPFPFDDLSSSKLRPVLCLTNSIGPHHHVIVAFITSKALSDTLPTDLILRPSDPDFIATGLRVTSTVRLHRLTTITVAIIQRELGRMSRDRMEIAYQRLINLFQPMTP